MIEQILPYQNRQDISLNFFSFYRQSELAIKDTIRNSVHSQKKLI